MDLSLAVELHFLLTFLLSLKILLNAEHLASLLFLLPQLLLSLLLFVHVDSCHVTVGNVLCVLFVVHGLHLGILLENLFLLLSEAEFLPFVLCLTHLSLHLNHSLSIQLHQVPPLLIVTLLLFPFLLLLERLGLLLDYGTPFVDVLAIALWVDREVLSVGIILHSLHVACLRDHIFLLSEGPGFQTVVDTAQHIIFIY